MNCKIIILTLCLGLFALTGFAQPHILSHRGFYTNPKVDENSIDALREAQRLHHDMGLEACEFDVHMTADGELVVRHAKAASWPKLKPTRCRTEARFRRYASGFSRPKEHRNSSWRWN